jgi:hypothetical protein
MKYSLLLMIVFLVGCTPSPLSKAKQNYLCKEHGGVSSYTYLSTSCTVCRDGTQFHPWYDTIIPMEDLEEMYKIGEGK